MSEKITMNNTKKEMLEKIQELENNIKNNMASVFDPKAEASKKKVEEDSAVAKKLVETDIDSLIDGLRTGIEDSLTNLVEKITKSKVEYTSLTDTIKEKKKDLKELFDIEANAYTLAAIIQSQAEKREKFEEEYNSKKADSEAELRSTQELIKTMKEEAEQEIEDAKNEAAAEAKKKSEEDEYNFKRERQIKLDKVDDEIKDKWKAHKALVEQDKEELKARGKELDEREEDLEKKEDHVQQLEEEVAAFPDKLAQAKEEAFTDAKAKEGKSHAIEVASLKREADNKDKYHEMQVKSLEEKNQELEEKNKELQDKLDKAYTRIQEMAIEQSKAHSSSSALDVIKKMQSEK